MIMKVSLSKRMPVPPLVPRQPACPVCGDGVEFDADYWWCDPCGFTWNHDGYDSPGELCEDIDQCGAEYAPYATDEHASTIRHFRYRCVLRAGHLEAEPSWSYQYHVGLRCDGGFDLDQREWRDADLISR